jgi:hypothetical protein
MPGLHQAGPATSEGRIMESASSSENGLSDKGEPARTAGGKISIRSVVSHKKLMAWIKERNPIIAQARKDDDGRSTED